MSTTRRGALAAMGAAVLASFGVTVQPRVQARSVRRSKPYIDSCPKYRGELYKSLWCRGVIPLKDIRELES